MKFKAIRAWVKKFARNNISCLIVSCAILFTISSNSYAVMPADVPSSARVDRFKPKEEIFVPDHSKEKDVVPQRPAISIINMPAAAKNIRFIFKGANIEGVTVFSEDELKDIYKDYIDKEVSLEIAWFIAGAVTEKYRSNGYFLSRAYVPEQGIENGIVTIKVVEGYIGKVELENSAHSNYIVRWLIDDLVNQHPVNASQVESFLLRLNDIPGYSYQGVLSQLDSADEAAVMMTLVSAGKKANGSIDINNFGSRFIGPQQVTGSLQGAFLPLQQINVSLNAALPTHEVKSGYLQQVATITPYLQLAIKADVTKSSPGFTLRKFEIKSRSNSFGASLNYQVTRQRQENLSLKLALDAKNSNTDLLGNQISHDAVRAARLIISYDGSDAWSGYNVANVTLSKGINGLSGSDVDDPNLSRLGVTPDFGKAEISLFRQQPIDNDFALITSLQAQAATDPLFSSEEFGYGGQAFGRAYDSSDLTGDHGIAGAVEVRYNWPKFSDEIALGPYAFYDIGKVWNIMPSSGQKKTVSGSSAGFGLRFDSAVNLSGNIGFAFPLTKEIATPIYGGSHTTGPRVLLQVTRSF